MGKKSRNQKTVAVTPKIGEPLHIKHLGKPLYVASVVIDSETIHEPWLLNSEEGIFTSLPENLPVIPFNKTPHGQPGTSLGLLIFTTPTLVDEVTHTATGEFLPFLAGESIGWRNPKIGHLIQEEDSVLETLKTSADFYTEMFPGYDNIYHIEEVIDPMGWSSSLMVRINNQIKSIKL